MCQSACVKQKPAVGQPLNLQTLPFCVLLLLVVSIYRAEARLWRANAHGAKQQDKRRDNNQH
jgi:hypothetical protein